MKRKNMKTFAGAVMLATMALTLAACQNKEDFIEDSLIEDVPNKVVLTETVKADSEVREIIEEKEEKRLELTKPLKSRGNTNPIMTQAFGADPFVLVYKDTAYIYMTADAIEYEADGSVKENTYSSIRSIHVVSTKDFKNFEDHGEVIVGGEGGATKWAKNSWAPAAAYKNIDGKDKFFLYFADNGGGIGVLEADSPTGPFTDPLGHALISRSVPTCDSVLWLFDPAVLVDDDGTGYIYFGGGVPEGKIAEPGTGRVAKLGADMISLDGDPVALDVPYLFEDSGIHKFNNKYYYTYCTNWNVPDEATKEFGFTSGEIACLVSDSPMGPFTYRGKILENPGKLCGLYGNNHHAVFSMGDKWYIAYHSRMLEKNMGLEKGYRATFIDEVSIKEDGNIGIIYQTKDGPKQLKSISPYESHSAVCVAMMAGTNAVKNPAYSGEDNLCLGEIETGDYVEIDGVDFGLEGPKEVLITVIANEGACGKIHVRLGMAGKEDIAVIDVKDLEPLKETLLSAPVTGEATGEDYMFLVFEGEDFVVKDWKFN